MHIISIAVCSILGTCDNSTYVMLSHSAGCCCLSGVLGMCVLTHWIISYYNTSTTSGDTKNASTVMQQIELVTYTSASCLRLLLPEILNTKAAYAPIANWHQIYSIYSYMVYTYMCNCWLVIGAPALPWHSLTAELE